MPGVFSKDNRPARPGAYFDFEAGLVERLQPPSGSIVALPITHDWGPFEKATLCLSWDEFRATFGRSDTTGSRAVKQAFKGEGLPDAPGGAAGVLVYRHGASSAAKAAHTFLNTTPASSLVVTARYEGTHGNSLTVTIEDYVDDSSRNAFIIKLSGSEVERFIYSDTNVADLATQINAHSDWVTATASITGVALALVTDVALTAGNDGATNITGANVTTVLSSLEPQRFGLFCWQDVAGTTYSGTSFAATVTSTVAWAVGTEDAPGLNLRGKRVMVVLGGTLDESYDTANSRSASIGDYNVVNLGGGHVIDHELIADSDLTLSTSLLAPRLAGIVAARGESQSFTFARLKGVELGTGPTEQEVLDSFSNGTVVVSRDSDTVAPVRFEKALTTYVNDDDPLKPYLIFRNPKFVRTMHGIETELTEFAERTIIGRMPVNDATREHIVGEMLVRIQRRVDAKILQPGATVDIDRDPPPSDDDEFIQLVYGIKFGRSTEQVFNTVRVG